jgi:hypothetical protein
MAMRIKDMETGTIYAAPVTEEAANPEADEAHAAWVAALTRAEAASATVSALREALAEAEAALVTADEAEEAALAVLVAAESPSE